MGPKSISSVDHEETMQALQEMDESTPESAPVDPAVPYGTSIYSVPEDVYPIVEAEEDILATTSPDVFNPHAVIPEPETEQIVQEVVSEEEVPATEPEVPEFRSGVAESESAVPVVALPRKLDVADVAAPDVPQSDPAVSPSPSTESELRAPVLAESTTQEPVSVLPPPEEAPIPVVAREETHPPETARVLEPELPEPPVVETVEAVDPPEIVPGSDSSSELELDFENVGRIPENMPPPPPVTFPL